MKNLLIAVLLACCQAVSAQSIDQIIDARIKASEVKQKAYADSLFKKGDGGGTTNPPNDLPPCVRGPEPLEIYNVTTTSAVVLWDGFGVEGLDYSIYKGTSRLSFGSLKPVGNREPITYAGLAPGTYTLSMQGNTCKSAVYSKTFIVPEPTGDNGNGENPPPVNDKSAKFEFILGTTGSGFNADAKHGIDDGWVDRIEAFHYSWGWGITGVCIWVPWDSYEPTPGNYQTAAMQRVIEYCRDRKLSLSVAFIGRRRQNDGFIFDSEIIKGSNGTLYLEGVPGFGSVYAGYGCDRVNALMTGAIQSIAKLMKTYDKSFYMAMAGGGAGELVNHTFQNNGIWEVSDLSRDNQNRFNEWAIRRGIAGPGPPPIMQGPGIDWPYPDYNKPEGLEFGRFTTYGIYKYYKNFVDAVKRVSDLPCIYFYSVTSNRQFRAIQNPNLNFIASTGDGMYGSDGDGPDELFAKIKVNSVNLGTFPNGISAAEVDPDDISPSRHRNGRMPRYCEGNLDYNAFLKLARDAYSRGLRVMHTAMAYCPDEIRAWGPTLKILNQEYIGKQYVRPAITASNTVTVNVTEKYRASQDLMEGINPYEKYTKYTDVNFWGGVSPDGSGGGTTNPPPSNSKITGYLDSNLGAYSGNVRVDIKRQSGTIYSYARGNVASDDPVSQMSTSKGVTAATLLTFYDEGKLGVEDKVSKYIPSWNRSDKANITIRQVVSHTSGVHDETRYDGYPTLEAAVDGMANTPLDFPAGADFRYSTTSYQVLARIAEVIAGKNWEQIFNERIRYKCGMTNAQYNPASIPITGNPRNPNAGYGLYASHNDMSNFAAMLRDGGMYNGQVILSPKAISLLRTNMTNGRGDWGFGFILDGGNMISESAAGISLCVKLGEWSYVLTTQSTYEKTIAANNGLRKLVESNL